MTVTAEKRKFQYRTGYAALLFVALLLVTASCGSRKHQVSTKYTEVGLVKDTKSQNQGNPMSNTPTARSLVAEAREWIGTPYKYGGETKSGADCSGFVMKVYHKVTGLKLPRNSAAQCDFCTKIKKEELETGDLIFFSSNSSKGRVAHVGMYIGDGIMIHASSSRGVIEASIHSDYFVRHYVASGRVPNQTDKSSSKQKSATKTQPVKTENKKTTVSKPAVVKEIRVEDLPQKPPTVTVETVIETTVETQEETPEEIVKHAFGIK